MFAVVRSGAALGSEKRWVAWSRLEIRTLDLVRWGGSQVTTGYKSRESKRYWQAWWQSSPHVRATQDGGGNVEIDEDGGVVAIESGDGEESIVFSRSEVPADFPIPVAPGGSVVTVLESGNGSAVTIGCRIDEYENIAGFYGDFASGAGIEIVNTTSNSDPNMISWFLGDGEV